MDRQLGAAWRVNVQIDVSRRVANEVDGCAGVDAAVSYVKGGDDQKRSDGVFINPFQRLCRNRKAPCSGHGGNACFLFFFQ